MTVYALDTNPSGYLDTYRTARRTYLHSCGTGVRRPSSLCPPCRTGLHLLDLQWFCHAVLAHAHTVPQILAARRRMGRLALDICSGPNWLEVMTRPDFRLAIAELNERLDYTTRVLRNRLARLRLQDIDPDRSTAN